MSTTAESGEVQSDAAFFAAAAGEVEVDEAGFGHARAFFEGACSDGPAHYRQVRAGLASVQYVDHQRQAVSRFAPPGSRRQSAGVTAPTCSHGFDACLVLTPPAPHAGGVGFAMTQAVALINSTVAALTSAGCDAERKCCPPSTTCKRALFEPVNI